VSLFRLLVALSICSLAACGGSSINPSPGTSTPVTVQADPADDPLNASDSAVGDVSGHWYCAPATALTAALNGEYLANWSNPYELHFNEDRTLVRLSDGEGVVSGTWWYTTDGVTIQWSDGNISEYQANVANLGGMADGSSHCLRELPAGNNTGDDLSSDAIPTYDCGNGSIVGFASDGRLVQNGAVSGQWRSYLGNGIGTPTPDADIGFTYVEFNNVRYTVIDDTLLQEFGEWSCFSVNSKGPLLQLLAPVP